MQRRSQGSVQAAVEAASTDIGPRRFLVPGQRCATEVAPTTFVRSACAHRGHRGRRPLVLIAALAFMLIGWAMPAASAAAQRPTAGVDPARGLEQALAAARAGDHSLARAWLEPVLIAPRLDRATRARAYHLRGLLFYLDGLHRSAGQDYRRALEFLPTLAPARSALAWLHLRGRGVPRDPARARALYRLAARQGHAESRFNLALLLMKDTPARPREALAWFEAAAAAGHAEAAVLAGQLLARGHAGIEPDPARARALLERAADRGHPGARLELGMLLEESDPLAARDWYRSAAERGVAAAQSRLGHLLLQGAPGIEPDRERALMWIREAAKQGDARAQSWLGWAYDAGVGVRADPREALRWYTRAARRDDASAQVNLARLHESGRGTPRSMEQALYWYEQAAQQGELGALTGLAWLLATTPRAAMRDAERALALAREAVERDPGPRSLEALAAALAESGQYAAAVRAQQRALGALDASASDPEAATSERGRSARVEASRSRLAAYRAGRPWRAQ